MPGPRRRPLSARARGGANSPPQNKVSATPATPREIPPCPQCGKPLARADYSSRDIRCCISCRSPRGKFIEAKILAGTDPKTLNSTEPWRTIRTYAKPVVWRRARVLNNKSIEAIRDWLELTTGLEGDAIWGLPTTDVARRLKEAYLNQSASIAKVAAKQQVGTHVEHSPDFRSVIWSGTRHSFTANQAACVRVLWEAWEKRTLDLAVATILEAAESDSQRLSHVFRGHGAWRTMIVAGERRGTYRLSEPTE